MKRLEKTTLQLRAVSVLRRLKSRRTYDELADVTGLSASDLNRYVNGHVLPGVERAREIVDDLGRETLAAEIESRIDRDEEGYVDNTAVVFDQSLLDLVAGVAAETFELERPDVVLTAATDGITIAGAMARHFDVPVAYAKKSRETGVSEFVEARQRLTPGIEITYSLPASALEDGDDVLLVDDFVRSGNTQALLLELADRAGATVSGVFTLIAVGEDGLASVRQSTDAPVVAFTTLSDAGEPEGYPRT
ncbi:adenine phosphoribosyltransferase protein [Halorhabdus tiamatea SARL4B]|uniref:Adenine phosphoribosyltransferase n=1 Tax=Halorhabdus tiamatea SARL4B TaxID=1033806 RepID=F7PK57_9EURY|nr:phosphoribosyltransferase family protein [Halorhabdus tiamatea]ERJ07590.1 adenine phosphoribosyltransferase protein [Halorhabdus tiamatea SARL4B]CCQ33460.1 adenine phosphoribosyltransferase [Halorhabdus tiamatea SARL4B]